MSSQSADNKTFTLYGLKRPDEDRIRYIGITCSDLGLRLSQHISDKVKNPHKVAWIEKMRPLRPEIIPLAVSLEKEEATYLEIFVISKARESGIRLINVSSGGETGLLGIKHSWETRQKISKIQKGKKLSETHKQKISLGLTGRKVSQETRDKIRNAQIGKPKSDALRRNMSLGALGKKHSIDTRRKMSQSRMGERNPNFGRKYSIEERKRLSESQRLRQERERQERILSEMWR